MAQIIIAKHRKGATGDVLLTFRGQFTRFENPEDTHLGPMPGNLGGEIVGSRINGESGGFNPSPADQDNDPFASLAAIPPPDMNNGNPPF
jgi:replicative DNA helicase